jgi:hypothetical protein
MEGAPGPMVVKFADTDKQKRDKVQMGHLAQQQQLVAQMYQYYQAALQVCECVVLRGQLLWSHIIRL